MPKKWSDIQGWFSDRDADFASGLCRRARPGVVVEIGVLRGRATAVMAPLCRDGGCAYHAVDNFRGGSDPGDPAAAAQRTERVLTSFRRNMKSLGLWDYITVHKSDSSAASAIFPDGSVELCFIDADHTFEGVTRDMEAWWPKIRPGGAMAGHDYRHTRKHGVRPAVDAFAARAGLPVGHGRLLRRSQRHCCWAVRRPG